VLLKIKKILVFILIFVSSILSFTCNKAIFFADSSTSAVISPLFLNDAEFSLDLTDITFFDINSNYIVYANNSSTTLTILNRKNKNIDHLTIEVDYETIYIKLTCNFLFVGIKNVTNKLVVFNLTSKEEVFLKDTDGIAMQLYDYNYISIMETSLQSENCILIATTSSTELTYYHFSTNNLNCIRSSMVQNTQFSNHSLSYIALSYDGINSSNIAYVVGSGTGNKLFKITLDNGFYIAVPTRFYPANKFVSLITVQNIYETEIKDYLVAVSYEDCTIKIVKTTTLSAPPDDKETNWTKGPESLENNSFKKGVVNHPCDAKFFNGKVYVSDRGTKSIQSFTLEIDNADTMNFNGVKVVAASFCAEIGRFNPNSHLSNSNAFDRLLVSDSENNRLQLILNDEATEIPNTIGSNPSHAIFDNDNNIYYSVKKTDGYSFIKYSLEDSQFVEYTSYLSSTSSHPLPEIYSITYALDNVFLVAANVFIMYSKQSNTLTEVSYSSFTPEFNNTNILTYLPQLEQLLFYSNNQLIRLNYNSASVFLPVGNVTNITDVSSIAVDNNDNIFMLIGNSILKYKVEDNQIVLDNELTNDIFSDYNNISINKLGGNIYAFNNKTCSIETISLPTFNLIEQPKRVITTTHNVAIYKNASGLNGEVVEILAVLPIDIYLDIYSPYPVYKNGNKFFVVNLDNGGYGYVNVVDVFFDNEQIVKDLIISNARINIRDRSESVKLFALPDLEGTVICNLNNTHRIYVKNYDKESEFTFIQCYDENQQELRGYVQTKYVDLNEMDKGEFNALIILCAGLLLALVLFICYTRFREDKN